MKEKEWKIGKRWSVTAGAISWGSGAISWGSGATFCINIFKDDFCKYGLFFNADFSKLSVLPFLDISRHEISLGWLNLSMDIEL